MPAYYWVYMAAEVVSLLFPMGWNPVRAQAGKAHGVQYSLSDARKIMDAQEKMGKQEKGTTAVAFAAADMNSVTNSSIDV